MPMQIFLGVEAMYYGIVQVEIYIMGPRASQDLRSPSPIMAPDDTSWDTREILVRYLQPAPDFKPKKIARVYKQNFQVG